MSINKRPNLINSTIPEVPSHHQNYLVP